MARPIRVEYAGAVYHVMARGNQGQKIYADDGDRKMGSATVTEACRRTGWRIHAWVLMGNHYHLLLETPEANLVSGMKWLQGTYTHGQTTVTRRWIAEHLAMGYASRVSQAVSWVESKRAGPILKMKQRLEGSGADSTMNGPSL